MYVWWQKGCEPVEPTVYRMKVLFGGLQAAVARFQRC
jgi:hypothetical protein